MSRILAVFGALLSMAAASEAPRAMFGVVAEDAAVHQSGVLVRAVNPESPAYQSGIREGDVLLSFNGQQLTSRAQLRGLLKETTPGQQVEVDFVQQGKLLRVPVLLAARVAPQKRAAASADAAVGGDRVLRPLVVNPEIRAAMSEHRRAIIQQLRQLQTAFVPVEISDHLQAIRHLARDANPNGRGWMLGEAGEVTLQFKTEEGVMVLHGASNKITLSVYDKIGELNYTLPLNTPEERAAVPQAVRERLQRLR